MSRLLLSLPLLLLAAMSLSADESERPTFTIVIHGGAGIEPDKLDPEKRRTIEEALARNLEVGRKLLADGGTSLDAVEQTIRALEDDPLFNAGYGSVFNSEGRHELDASIMDGETRKAGAVAAISTVKNPISLARLVMTQTRHVLLVGDGAEKFADEMKGHASIERVKNEYFTTEAKRKEQQEAVERARRKAEEAHRGTVGCVALDRHGNLAAGTSTGGITNKKWGRIGDSPIIGAGTYADNKTCAVSCTGTGEHFIRNSASFHVAALMQYKGLSLDDSVRHVIEKVLDHDTGGMIALDAKGNVSARFNTPGMSHAWCDSTGRKEVKLGK